MFFHGYTVAPAGADEALQKVGRVGRGNALEALFKLNVTGPCISHDVALTENFLVVLMAYYFYKQLKKKAERAKAEAEVRLAGGSIGPDGKLMPPPSTAASSSSGAK